MTGFNFQFSVEVKSITPLVRSDPFEGLPCRYVEEEEEKKKEPGGSLSITAAWGTTRSANLQQMKYNIWNEAGIISASHIHSVWSEETRRSRQTRVSFPFLLTADQHMPV